MGLLLFIVVGAIAGWLAGQFMRGNGFGLPGDIVGGVLGAFIGIVRLFMSLRSGRRIWS